MTKQTMKPRSVREETGEASGYRVRERKWSSETGRASLGWRESQVQSRKSTGWKGPEEVTQSGLKSMTVEEGRKQWEDGWVGESLLPVDYLYNGQLPHRSQG